MFIKVTEYMNPYKLETRNDVRTLYINVNKIECFKYSPSTPDLEEFLRDYTQIATRKNCFNCVETPEEIMKLIEEANNGL